MCDMSNVTCNMLYVICNMLILPLFYIWLCLYIQTTCVPGRDICIELYLHHYILYQICTCLGMSPIICNPVASTAKLFWIYIIEFYLTLLCAHEGINRLVNSGHLT